MKKFFRKYLLYVLFVLISIFILLLLFTGKINQSVSDFLEGMEDKTFDLRQEITSSKREHNKDIIIVSVDDNTYEYILEKYGEWPMPRYIYSDIVDFIEAQNPKLIAFDLLFVNPVKKAQNNYDEKLSNLFKKYDNLYTSIYFDEMEADLREPAKLDKKLTVSVDNRSKSEIFSEPNYKPILTSIINNTSNIGHINTKRAKDGVIRDFIPFVFYKAQQDYFPHISLLTSLRVLGSNTRSFTIDKNMNLRFDDKSYPINVTGSMFLHWYKKKDNVENESTVIYDNISIADIIKADELHKNGQPTKFDNIFKDKIVYIGTTAANLGDIKTVPIEKYVPGIEIHTTFVNNMLDNSFIKRLSLECDIVVTVILSILLTVFMLKVEYSKINYRYLAPINIVALFILLISYYLFSLWIMQHHNIWVAVIMPTIGIIATFMLVYIMRYFFKSQDYEYTYRLATTDGLTELYNHRFFQEKMIECVENSKKSGKKFSLILTDIDFFKKFNDTYGHQAGDTVLRQVAKILKRHVKKTDYVCRYGGEEMSVILLNTDNKKAIEIAERLCKAVSSNICKLSEDLEVNISLGVSTYPDNGSTPSELIEYSDRGLYAAKENGRNQVGVVEE